MGDSRYSIALVLAAPFPALQGSQVLVHHLAQGLAERGHRVHLVAYGTDAEALVPPVTVHRLPRLWGCRITASGPHPAKLVLDSLLAWRLLRVVVRENIDLIHAHNYEGAIAGLLVGRLTRRPVVYHGHSAMVDELPSYFSDPRLRRAATRIGSWLDRHVPCRADYCIGVTADLVALLRARGVRPDDVEHVVPGGLALDPESIDAPKEAPPGAGATLLYAGNLDRYQNLDFLLRSFATVRAARPHARLLLVTHSERHRYRRHAVALAHAGVHVIQVRTFPAARALITAADVALCPRTETTGFPIKLLNYMAAGKAIVACEGSAKLLRDGETAVIVANGDEQAFAGAVVGLLDDPEKRRRLGRGARAAVQAACASEPMFLQIESIYRRVLSSRGRAPGGRAVQPHEGLA
jgi:glycosyltransferase involved in cell wall biosynthesis